MASTDFLENVISSKVDENIVSDLANSLESSISNGGGGTQPGARMMVRSVDPGGQNVLRAAPGQVVAGGQRLVARPVVPGQQVVRTSGGQQIVLQQQPGQTIIRQQVAGQAVQANPAVQRVVINQPGVRPGQPGSQISVPLSTLQALQPGQGIPTGTPGHLLVKTESGQYQILRVGPPGPGGATTLTAQPRPQAVAGTPVRLPTQPVPVTRPPPAQPPAASSPPVSSSPAPASTAATTAGGMGGMGQQMTPDTAKIKCRNFLATLLRLASDQPDAVAKNVRELIQGLIESRIEPEIFTTKLQKELNSSPQPCLVPFLKKSLPYLQHSLASRELTIEGVTAPSMSQVGKLPVSLKTGGSTVMRPAPARPTLPSRPLQLSSNNLMPPPRAPALVIKKSSGGTYSAAGDDDINDVAAMGGVNLADEASRIGGNTDIGSLIRSCKDEAFLQTGLLSQKVTRICKEKGLEQPPQEVLNLISHATQERLKTMVSKLSIIAEHRLDVIKTEGNYDVTQDIKQQLRFLEDLDKMEKKRHEEAERELLLRAAKSRTKTDDPEREKLKAKAKEIQRDEAERIRHEEANRTALEAIGGPKKRKFGEMDSLMGPPQLPVRSRTKRVHLRDVMFLMEQEKRLKHSDLLYRCYFS